MRFRSLVALGAASVALTGCDGLKEALTAHVDVAARAADQELSVTRLSELLGNAQVPVPVTRENAALVADLWVTYQQLAHAAARGDSLTDRALIDEATSTLMKNARLRAVMDSVSRGFAVDSGSEATYARGEGGLYAARHILWAFPPAATQTEKDSVRQRVLALRPTITAANFQDMARRHSQDPGSAEQGGNLGVFDYGRMVAPFSAATAELRPGEISGPVETQYGYHVIQRLPYAQARAEYAEQYAQLSMQRQDSIFMAKLDEDARITVRDNAGTQVRNAVREPGKHRRSSTTLATYRGGELSVGTFIGWVESFPQQMRLMQQIQDAPDSLIKPFVKSIAQREVMLQQAGAGESNDRAELYQEFAQVVGMAWQALGVTPESLADSARSVPERERLAASRAEAFLDRILAGQAQPLQLPTPVEAVLAAKYKSSVNSAGLDRATERAIKLRASADSARAANQPRSQVPLPGMPGQQP